MSFAQDVYTHSRAAPHPQEKTRKYRFHETNLRQVQARMDAILRELDALRAADGDPRRLLDEYARLEKQAATHLAAIERAHKQMKLAERSGQALERVRRLDAQYWEVYGRYYKASAELALVQTLADEAMARATHAHHAYVAALEDLEMFQVTGSPRFTVITAGTNAGTVYRSECWVPDEELAYVRAEMAKAQEALDRFSRERQLRRQDLVEASSRVQDTLSALSSAITRSIVAQAGVEVVFTATDVAVACSKFGVYGVLAECVRKGVETATTGLPRYYSSEFDEVRRDYEPWIPAPLSALKTGGKRLVKSTITGPVASQLAAQAALDRSCAAFHDALERDLHLAEKAQRWAEYDAAARQLEASRVGLSAANVKKMGASFLFGLLKDATKETTKKALAEVFEGDAMLDYMEADGEARTAAFLLQRASAHYWEADDLCRNLSALRQALVEQYDPVNGTKVTQRGQFDERDVVTVALTDAAMRPDQMAGREVEVFLGGRRAIRDGETLNFRVEADQLQHDGDGGVALEVRVIR